MARVTSFLALLQTRAKGVVKLIFTTQSFYLLNHPRFLYFC